MTAEERINELVRAYIRGNQGDLVRFVDELLLLTAEVGEIKCAFAGDRALRFETPQQPGCEVELERAKSKLRMCCARLAVLCNESGGQDVSIYGGEGIIVKAVLNGAAPRSQLAALAVGAPATPSAAPDRSAPSPERWAVRFKNTPSEQEFVIQTQ